VLAEFVADVLQQLDGIGDILAARSGQEFLAQLGGAAANTFHSLFAGGGQAKMFDTAVGFAAATFEQTFLFHMIDLPDQGSGFDTHVMSQFAMGTAVMAREMQQQQPARMRETQWS